MIERGRARVWTLGAVGALALLTGGFACGDREAPDRGGTTTTASTAGPTYPDQFAIREDGKVAFRVAHDGAVHHYREGLVATLRTDGTLRAPDGTELARITNDDAGDFYLRGKHVARIGRAGDVRSLDGRDVYALRADGSILKLRNDGEERLGTLEVSPRRPDGGREQMFVALALLGQAFAL